MNNTSVSWLAPAQSLVTTAALTMALSLFTSAAGAQQSISELFNAFDVTKAAAMEKLVEINDNPYNLMVHQVSATQIKIHCRG